MSTATKPASDCTADLINRGYVEDRGPSFGGAPERFVLTNKGRDELAGRGWVA